ncbi:MULTISPECIES: WecB/TagA/CpsF family glycosyltransferase [Stenotrophomonas]|uniref:WecB/TagA/CpsF family glycosyltransferase n=1 Tax=Stenotrophomonas TaxID=40323 RepID=UPI000B70D21D|nr:WecB/TagA/CpsF family glycosyltransferase [Stenotrophomonas sp. CC120222-04]SNT84063.1 N-acetylglucosaminyldiphosphoundecaprenol N-acetyl-beta-D-mannosaminyltransferase [Stenotrophomonas sp. CC120222-04]
MPANAIATLYELAGLLGRSAPDWREFRAGQPEAWLVTFANPHSVRLMMDRQDYSSTLAQFDVVLPDGNLLAQSATRQLGRTIERKSFDGNSLAPEVLSFCQRNRLRVALVGGVEGVASAAASLFRKEFGVEVVFTRSGFFANAEQRNQCFQALREQNVDVVICGMGAPHQDRFLLELKASGWRGLGFTCGGYLDQALASGVKYYPDWVNRFNLRAPYRLLREPRRLWRRYLIEYQPFLLADVRLRLRNVRHQQEQRS